MKDVKPKKHIEHILLLVFTVIALAGAVFATIFLFTRQNSVKTPTTSVTVQCKKTVNFVCYSKYYQAEVMSTSALATLADIEKTDKVDGFSKSQCHQLTHNIGHAAFKKYGTLGDAFTKGNNYCWSGYYHGVTESAITALGADKIRTQANTICAKLAAKARYSFDHYNCAHGVGHGFSAVEDNNLFTALNDCDLLTDGWERSSCYGGVFMENVMVAVRGDGTSPYLRPEEPMYPCTAVATNYKRDCYMMASSYALQQNGYDFAKVARLCQDLVDHDFVSTCYQSLGRDASGNTNSNLEGTKAHCDTAIDQNGKMNCMLGAVRDIIGYYHDDQQGKAFCELYEDDIKTVCQRDVVSYYSSFKPRAL